MLYAFPPPKGFTFRQYAQRLKSILEGFFEDYKRIDLVFDVYRDDSLKNALRQTRGKGARRRPSPEVKVPDNWSMFLRDNQNKEELIEFLADHLIAQSYPANKILYITCKDQTLCNKMECLLLSDHEEADT